MRFPRTQAQPGLTRAAAPDPLAATISQGFTLFGTLRCRDGASYERRIVGACGERRRRGRGGRCLPRSPPRTARTCPGPLRLDRPVRTVTGSASAVEPRRSLSDPSRHEPFRQPERWFLSGCYPYPLLAAWASLCWLMRSMPTYLVSGLRWRDDAPARRTAQVAIWSQPVAGRQR